MALDLQSLHISELYECMACCAVLFLLVAEALASYNKLAGHIFLLKIKEQEQEGTWIRSTIIDNKQASEFDKSAKDSLRREMSEAAESEPVEKPVIEPQQPKDKSSVLQFLSELTPSQKTVLLFHVEYSNFVSEHISLILPVMVIGILTESVQIFSLACFFCFLFSSLLFDFMHLEERLKSEYKRGVVLRRIVKILSSFFIIGIFISYWASDEFQI